MKFDWRKSIARIIPPKESDGYQHVHGAKVLEEFPPIYNNIVAVFQVNPHVIFTYGDTIYNPHKLHLSEDLVAHEKVHMEQQGHNDESAALWWGKYLRDDKFRLDQEAAAYAEQYAFLEERVKDREHLNRILNALASSLSGPLYGNCIDHAEASLLIKAGA